MSKQMTGVCNTIKEFSDTYDDLYNSWKYTIGQDDDNIIITYMEKENNKWIKKDEFPIKISCAHALSDGLLDCFVYEEFSKNY